MAASMFAGDSRGQAAMAEMNITPLVDVMLVLLIIFMVAAPMVTRTMDVRLPQTPPDSRVMEKPQRLALGIEANGSYTLDGVPMEASVLQATLSEVGRRNPKAVLSISSNTDADYQAFTNALAAARNGGIANIAIDR